ncbi:hypothetical protein BD626DRAFT_471787 [Schizophyllum amplum]|uniref:Uncharacterized protein n=1 Tax=Schizophyllum amplum TaxID=97359 RepID=A0A550CVF0_9AGAR|nr:hypothetical protein BD626DRAFT_471787 [Auriculariopsis ampla]
MASLALACTAGVVARTLVFRRHSEPTLQPTAPRARRRGSSTWDHVTTAACPSSSPPKFNNCAEPTTRGAMRPRCHLGLIMTVVCCFGSCGRPARMSVRRREVCCCSLLEQQWNNGLLVDLPVSLRLVRVQ